MITITLCSPPMATITKREIILHVTDQLEKHTQQEVLDVVQAAIDYIGNRLARGDEVVMRNFGTFEVRLTKPKKGRNPKCADTEMVIPSRAVVKFRPGKELRERVAQRLPALQVAARRAARART